MSKVKREHYVPQFYLKNFSHNEKNLWVYDKVLNKSFPSNIHGIASKRYFYDFPEEVNQALGVEQYIEEYFRPAELEASKVINDLISALEDGSFTKISSKQRETLSIFLVFQFIRTKEFREMLIEGLEKITKAAAEKVVGKDEVVDVKFNKEHAALQHAEMIVDYDWTITVADLVRNHIWILCKNDTEELFYTSDHPVTMRGHLGTIGFAAPGIEISYPISSTSLLLICERGCFKHFETSDGMLISIDDPDNVIYYNSMQVWASYRQIYCEREDFSLVEEMCKDNPELMDPDNKTRFIVN